MYWNGNDVGGNLISLMVGLLIAVIVFSVIFRVIDRVGHRVGHRVVEPRPTPDEVLAERYARGEITDEEYQHRRHVLHDDDHAVS
jgi:putative membrane protein